MSLQPTFRKRISIPLVLTLILINLSSGFAYVKKKPTEYQLLQTFPPGRLLQISAGDRPDKNGLNGANRENGSWLEVGPQRGGCRSVAIAVARGDLQLADESWRAIDVAFSHQLPEGNFEVRERPNGQSAKALAANVETTYFFLQELGRTILLIRDSPYEKHFHSRIEDLLPKLRIACDYISKGYDTIIPASGHAVNRVILAAKAFGLCGKVLNDPKLIEQCRKLIAFSLTRRDAEGVFIEKGGRDSSYNVVSILYGQILGLYVDLPELEAAIPKAMSWELGMISDTGEVIVAGNTRTGVGKEQSYFGTPKNVNYNEVLMALSYYGAIQSDKQAIEKAALVAEYIKRKSK